MSRPRRRGRGSRAAAGGAARRPRRPCRRRAGATTDRIPNAPYVILLERRGATLSSASPFFDPGAPRHRRPRPARRPPRSPRPRAAGRRAGAPESCACSAAPRRARRARGADARPRVAPPLPERRRATRRARPSSPAAAARAATSASCRPSRSTRRPRKDFDDAISAEELGDGAHALWVHIADVARTCGPATPLDREAYRRATSVYVPGAVEPMLPEALSNDACSLVPGADRLAVTAEIELRRRASRQGDLLPLADPLRRAARLRPASTRSSPAARRRRSRGPSRWRSRARSPPRCDERAARRGPALASSPPSPSSASTAAGTSPAADARSQTESHRLIEHLMIPANEAGRAAAREPRRADALPRPRAARPGRGRAPDRAARVARRADAAAPERLTSDARPPRSSAGVGASSTSTCGAPGTAARA